MKKSASTNTFTEGLVMDFNPLITPNNVLTGCLNGTIITNNGNELVLLNDMGNARVETAFLPEGYIPVGSCEFGDIIYIASYNPILDKCLLGCFPSPLRNITSDLITDLKLSLDAKEFLEIIPKENSDTITGKIIQSSLKKIIYENNLTSGDKYIISAHSLDLPYLTDLGNTDHVKDNFPKLYKINVVSIEEDGKITNLSKGLKWYPNSDKNNISKDFFLKEGNINIDEGNVDIDTWRSAVGSAYSIFSSKISGKLALLIELESITGFSCTWDIRETDNKILADNKVEEIEIPIGKEEIIVSETLDLSENNNSLGIKYKNFNVYFSINWETDNNNINPSNLVLTKSEWVDKPIAEYLEKNKEGNWETKTFNIEETNLPTVWPNKGYWNTKITRGYKPENLSEGNPITYKDFLEKYEFNNLITNEVITEKGKSGELDTKIKISNLEKIVVNPNNFGTYYHVVNGFSYVNDKEKKPEGYYYDNGKKAEFFTLTDDIVNNHFKIPVKKSFRNFKIPYKQTLTYEEGEEGEKETKTTTIDLNLINCVYNYKLAPCMPYGVLEEYAAEGLIDFGKIGKKDIKLTTWKYFNLDGYSTLTWGMDAYTEPEHKVKEVVIEFFDSTGFEGALHFDNKSSFNGLFTNYITLNTVDPNLSLKDHTGEEKPKGTENSDNSDKSKLPDRPILYSNYLYLARLCYNYVKTDELGNILSSTWEYEYRWFWTTKLFNDLYFLMLDFKDAPFTLDLLGEITYRGIADKWDWKSKDERVPVSTEDYEFDLLNPLTLSAVHLTLSGDEPNLQIDVKTILLNDYDKTFILDPKSKINYDICLAKESIEYSPELPTIKFSNKTILTSNKIYPKLKPSEILEGDTEMYDSITLELEGAKKDSITYPDLTTGKDIEGNYEHKEITGETSCSVELKCSVDHYSKYYYTTNKVATQRPVVKSFISTDEDCTEYYLDPLRHWFTRVECFGMTDAGGKDTEGNGACYEITYPDSGNYFSSIKFVNDHYYSRAKKGDSDYNIFTDIYTGDIKQNIIDSVNFLFPYSFAHEKRGGSNHYALLHDNHDGDWKGPYICPNPVYDVLESEFIGQNSVSDYPFGGGLACLDLKNSLMLTSPDVKFYGNKDSRNDFRNNAPIKYGEWVYSFLANCFYLSDYSEQAFENRIDNYIYLSDYTLNYKLDIVYKLEATAPIIIFDDKSAKRSIEFSMYVNNVINKVTTLKEKEKEEIQNSPNVTLIIKECKLILPLILQVPYQLPLMYDALHTTLYTIKAQSAVLEQVQKFIEEYPITFVPNTIYCFAKLISNSEEADYFGPLLNSCIFTNLEKTNEKFLISQKFVLRLGILGSKMVLLNTYSESGTSSIYVLKNNKKKSNKITGVPSELKIFKEVK